MGGYNFQNAERKPQIEFYLRLHQWYLKHKDFLDERSEYPNEKGYFPYKHH